MRNIKQPEFKRPIYKELNPDANRGIFEDQKAGVRQDQRDFESIARRYSTSAQDITARIANSKLGAGRQINTITAGQVANRDSIANQNTSRLNQFLQQTSNAEMAFDAQKYQRNTDLVATSLNLSQSNIAAIGGALDNINKGLYQDEEIQAIGLQYGITNARSMTTEQIVQQLMQIRNQALQTSIT